MKKTIFTISSIILIVAMLGGCSEKLTPREKLDASMTNTINMATVKQNFDMTMSIEADEESISPEILMFLGMLKNIHITGDFQLDNNEILMGGNLTVDLQGISYNTELYLSKEKYIVKIPMFNKYLLLYDYTEENASDNPLFQDYDKMKELSQNIYSKILNQLDDESIKELKEISIDLPSGSVKATPIEMSFTDAQMKELLKTTFTDLLEDPDFKQYIQNSMEAQNQMLGEGLQEEVTVDNFDESLDMLKESLDTIDEILSFDTVEVTYYLDKDNYIVKSDFNLLVTVIGDEETGMPQFTITLTGTDSYWDINKPIEITMPELTDENSMTLEDMVTNTMGGEMPPEMME